MNPRVRRLLGLETLGERMLRREEEASAARREQEPEPQPQTAPKNLHGELAGWLSLVTILSLLNYLSRSSGPPPKNAVYTWSIVASAAGEFAFVLAWVLVVARNDLRGLLALRRPSSWRLAIVLCVGVLLLVIALSGVLDPILHPGREQGLAPSGWRSDRAAQFAANFVMIAVVAPVVEELTYRGLGYSVLRPFGRWIAILGVGLAFGLSHGLIEGLPILVAFGAGLAYVRDRTGSVYPGMLTHAAYNAVVLILSVTT